MRMEKEKIFNLEKISMAGEVVEEKCEVGFL